MDSQKISKIAKKLMVLSFEIESPELAKLIKSYLKNGYEVDFVPDVYGSPEPSIKIPGMSRLWPVVRKKDIYPWTKITSYTQTKENLKELESGMDAFYSYLNKNEWEILNKRNISGVFRLLAEKIRYRISFSVEPYPSFGFFSILSIKYPKGTSRVPSNEIFAEQFILGTERRGDTIQTSILPILKKLEKLEEKKLEIQKRYESFYKDPEQIIHSDLIHYSDNPIPALRVLNDQLGFRKHDELNVKGLSTTYFHDLASFKDKKYKMILKPNSGFKAFVLDEEGYTALQFGEDKTEEFLKAGYDAIILPFGGFTGTLALPPEAEREEFEVLIIRPNSVKIKGISDEVNNEVTDKFREYAPELFYETNKTVT